MKQYEKAEILEKIQTEEDFINSKKHGYSLSRYLKKNPSGATDNVIAYFLCMTTKEIAEVYESAVKEYRQHLKLDI